MTGDKISTHEKWHMLIHTIGAVSTFKHRLHQ